MALKSLTAAFAFLLASTAMTLAQQSTAPIPPQIDVHPWIPPEPSPLNKQLHAAWANLTKPGVKHLRAVPHKENRSHGEYSTYNWSGMSIFPDGPNPPSGSGNLYTATGSAASIIFQVPSTAAPSTGCSGGYDGTACGVSFWVGIGGADDPYVTQAGFDILIDPASSTPQLEAFYQQAGLEASNNFTNPTSLGQLVIGWRLM
jgi:hypothetical protein